MVLWFEAGHQVYWFWHLLEGVPVQAKIHWWPVTGPGVSGRSYIVILLVAACPGPGGVWESPQCELKPAVTSTRLEEAQHKAQGNSRPAPCQVSIMLRC